MSKIQDDESSCCHVDQDRPSFFIPGITGKARCLSTSNSTRTTTTRRSSKSATARITKSASESHCMNDRSTSASTTRFEADSPYIKTQSDSALSHKTLLEFRAQRRKSSSRSAPDRLSTTNVDDDVLDVAQQLHECILGTILEKHNRLLERNASVWHKNSSLLDFPLTFNPLDSNRYDTMRAASSATTATKTFATTATKTSATTATKTSATTATKTSATTATKTSPTTATNTSASPGKPKRRKSTKVPSIKTSPATPRATKSSLKKKTKESPTAVHQIHEQEQHQQQQGKKEPKAPSSSHTFLPQYLLNDKNNSSSTSFQPFDMDDAFILPLVDNFPPPPPLLGSNASCTSEDTNTLSKPLKMEKFDERLDTSLLRWDKMFLTVSKRRESRK